MTFVTDNLLELRWRDIAAPFESLESDGSQALAEHARADRDGARVEGTGLNPYVFSIRIPFINGLARGPQETWDNLFPETFSKFQLACEDRSTGVLNHPIYGELTCKADKWKVTIDADHRGGVMFDVTFRQTSEDDRASDVGSTTLAACHSAAIDLDAQLGQLNPPISTGLPDGDSFEDLVNSFTAFGDKLSLFKSQILGKIDGAINSVNKIANSIDSTAKMIASIPGDTATTVKDLGNSAARIVESCTALNFALIGVKASLSLQDKPIGFFTTLQPSTIGALAPQLNNGVADLVELNPLLCSSPVIPAQTVVRYYTSRLKTSSPI